MTDGVRTQEQSRVCLKMKADSMWKVGRKTVDFGRFCVGVLWNEQK